MLFVALFLSTVHFLGAVLVSFFKDHLGTTFLICSGVLAFLALGIAMLPVCFQALVVGTLFCLYWWRWPNRPRLFLASSALAIVLIYAGASWHALGFVHDVQRQFPMQSMADRVPQPKSHHRRHSNNVNESWQRFEATLGDSLEDENRRYYSRTNLLQQLHEKTTSNFVNSPGFGVVRMPQPVYVTRYYDHEFADTNAPVAQPDASATIPLSTEELERPTILLQSAMERPFRQGDELSSLRTLHLRALENFVNYKGFGYVKDRKHVAGFRPHEFISMPVDTDVRVARLDLVSLPMHDRPIAYVSKELPRMKELKRAPTRNLTDFEARGLDSLEAGEDIFVRKTDSGISMLGAIRSVAQCVKCHGGERGDLLGAFSYSLTRISEP